jgi:transposase
MSPASRKEVEHQLKTAQQLGHVRQVKYLLAILAVMDGQSFAQVALLLRVHEKTVVAWVRLFCCYGLQSAPRNKPTGRLPKRPPPQKATLATLLDAGPVKAGFRGACWRSPLVQQLIGDRFGVFYRLFSIAQLLKNLGLSYQKPPSSLQKLERPLYMPLAYNLHGSRSMGWSTTQSSSRRAGHGGSEEARGPPQAIGTAGAAMRKTWCAHRGEQSPNFVASP